MELKLNRVDRLIVNAAAKDMTRPALHCVHVKDGAIEAANSFILMERKVDYTGEDVLLDIDDLAKHRDSKALGGVVYVEIEEGIKAIGQEITIINPIEGSFPETSKLYPTGDPVFKIALSRGELLNMLKCLDKGENLIKFYFYDKSKPVKIVAAGGDVTGLIMPAFIDWTEDIEVKTEGENDS